MTVVTASMIANALVMWLKTSVVLISAEIVVKMTIGAQAHHSGDWRDQRTNMANREPRAIP